MRPAAGAADPRALTLDERGRLRERLERERTRLRRRLARTEREAEEYRGRIGERDPCAYLSPATAREDAEQLARLQHAGGGAAELRQLEAALRLLQEEPERFGLCDRCGEAVSLARLEIVPQTRVCEGCARDRDAP